MVARLTPYPAYRDSGVEWLGRVPIHWDVLRANGVLRVTKRMIQPGKNGGESVLHYSIPNVQRYGRGAVEDAASIDSQKIAVDRDLLLVSKLNPRMGTIAWARPDQSLATIASSEFVAMEPRACLGRFARYLYASEPVRRELSSFVESATKSHQRCAPSDIAKMQAAWPPLEEQEGIAEYLDDAIARIRRYVRAKERLIGLLEEQKQALIQQAVTGQIDVRTGQPYPAYKDSGVEWLGRIPTGWQVRRLATVARLLVSNVDKHTRLGEVPVRLCNYVDVYRHEAVNEDMEFMRATASEQEVRKFRLWQGDVLITKDSEDWTDIGVPAVVERTAGDLVCGYHLAILRPTDRVSAAFLAHAIRCPVIATQFRVAARGVTRFGLTQNDIRTAVVVLPPVAEQARIAAHLDGFSRKCERRAACARRQIALAEEFRTRLISDVVTGKLDVRGVLR